VNSPTPNQPDNVERDPRKNVEINIGKACNNRCVFCIDGLPKREDRTYMDYEAMRTELERWYRDGHRSVGFLGGEPTTYPRIVESVAYARELGYSRIAIATNATKLRLHHFTDRILDAGLTRITISMHGHTPELEDRLTRVPGNFLKKVAAIQYLQAKRRQGFLKDGLSVNIVLNGWNAPHLPKMMQFFYRTMGLDDLRVNFIRPEGYAEGDADLTPRFKAVMPVLLKAIILNEQHFKKVFTFGGIPFCAMPPALRNNDDLLRRYMGEYRDLSTSCSIRSEGGDLIPPGETPDPTSWIKGPKSSTVQFDEAEGRARFNWQDRKKNDLKGQLEACRSCDFEPVCEGVWKGYLEIYGGTEFEALKRG
jgi:MoaA/NifB/PqqE/SkfB family radical SAM enzyme